MKSSIIGGSGVITQLEPKGDEKVLTYINRTLNGPIPNIKESTNVIRSK